MLLGLVFLMKMQYKKRNDGHIPEFDSWKGKKRLEVLKYQQISRIYFFYFLHNSFFCFEKEIIL